MKKIAFAPTILEHAAMLIERTPSETARCARLLAQAHVEAFKCYGHNVTVGIDVYNIEAEALGSGVRFYDDNSIPGIISHPLTIESSPSQIRFSLDLGRIKLLLDAATEVKKEIENEAIINVGICGPFSIFVELLGYEEVIYALYNEDERVFLFLEALLEFQKNYCFEIVSRGLGVVVFESWASPPLISSHIYRTYVMPFERELLSYMRQLGLSSTPLVIGGNTQDIIDDILSTGTTLLVSDYNSPLSLFTKKASEKGVTVRANIDPKLVRSGNWKLIKERIEEIHAQGELYSRIIIGTGVISHDTPMENSLYVKEMLGGGGALRAGEDARISAPSFGRECQSEK